jgi:hypothetical protein
MDLPYVKTKENWGKGGKMKKYFNKLDAKLEKWVSRVAIYLHYESIAMFLDVVAPK